MPELISPPETPPDSPALRRSARLQHEAHYTDFEMPGLLTPPEFPPAPVVDWPSWYDSLYPRFTLRASETTADYPGTNCVERAIIHGALAVAQRGMSATEQRNLILHVIRDAWLAANLCRDAGKEPEP